MGARKKRKCEECGEKANMAYDPQGLLCADCLKQMQDSVIHEHRNGRMSYHEAESILMDRLRLSRYGAEEMLFPPLGKGDFQNPRMTIKLSEHINDIREMIESE